MAKRVEMHRLQDLVRLHRLGTKPREVARLLRMGPQAERRYREALAKRGLLQGEPGELPDLEALREAVLAEVPVKVPPQQRSSVGSYRDVIAALSERVDSPTAIFDALRLEHTDFTGSLSAVKRMCLRLKRERGVLADEVAIPVVTGVGEIAQVDFGYVGQLTEPATGLLRKAWVFVMVLAYSRHMFARVAFDQRVETWLRLHVEAFEAFQGAPRVLVPDNLKAAVVRAAFGRSGDVALNRSYRELARHYGCKVDPAPPGEPKKKGRVEAGVKYVKRSYFKPRDLTGAPVTDVNAGLHRWVLEIAGQRVHGTTGRRPLAMFEAEERSELLPLAAERYLPTVWHKAKVHQDSQVVFERRPYIVPWRFVGKSVWVRAKGQSLEVYLDDTRIITHERGVPVPREIIDRCLPPERAPFRHRSREYWVERADALGEECGRHIREVFDSDDVLLLLRQVQAIVTHLEHFPPERVAKACARARYYSNHTYVGIRDILRKGLDYEPLPTAVAPAHGQLDSPRFARNPRELLDLPLELTDEPQ